MGSKNSKIPKPKLPDDNSSSSFPYVRGSKDARARSQQVWLPHNSLSNNLSILNKILDQKHLTVNIIFNVII